MSSITQIKNIIRNDNIDQLKNMIEKDPNLLNCTDSIGSSLLCIATSYTPLPVHVIKFLLENRLNPYSKKYNDMDCVQNITYYCKPFKRSHKEILGMMVHCIIENGYGLYKIFRILVINNLISVLEENKKKLENLAWDDILEIISGISYMTYNYKALSIFEYIIRHNQRKLLNHVLSSKHIDMRSEHIHIFIKCLLKYGARFNPVNTFFCGAWRSTVRSLKHIMQIHIAKCGINVPYKGLLNHNDYERETNDCSNKHLDILHVGYYDYVGFLYEHKDGLISID